MSPTQKTGKPTNQPSMPLASEGPSLVDVEPIKLDTVLAGDAKADTQPQSKVRAAMPQRALGRYQILAELGRGGMGSVHLAEDTVLTRQVALKIPQFDPAMAKQMEARFRREAQIAAQLIHPNICQVYDVGVIDGQLVMAMEYIDGYSLAALTRPDKLPTERQAVGLVRTIALALEFAHQKGLVHRDLKPSNIMLAKPVLGKQGVEPKVTDFGLATRLAPTGEQLTHSGMILGTPCYMPKEQWSGKEGRVGPQADVFSLGVILYQLLTGELPYDTEDDEPPTAWFVKLVTLPQVPLRQRAPQLDAAIEAIVMRAISIDAKDRFASMADFAQELDNRLALKTSRQGQARRTSLIDSVTPVLRNLRTSSVWAKGWKATKRNRIWLAIAVTISCVLLFSIMVIDSRFQREVQLPGLKQEYLRNEQASTNERSTKLEAVPVIAKSSALSEEPTALELPDFAIPAAASLPPTHSNSIGMDFVLVPAGEFMMGNEDSVDELIRLFPYGRKEWVESAAVRHRVRITKPFYLAQHEVSLKQFREFVVASEHVTDADKESKGGEGFNSAGSFSYSAEYSWRNAGFVQTDDHPVVNVSWNDALAFCEWLSAKEGCLYRLPTEAEWEYACRAGSTTRFQNGDDPEGLASITNVADGTHRARYRGAITINARDGYVYTSPKASYPKNPFGLYDMHGNVKEWCADWSTKHYFSESPVDDPPGPADGAFKVAKGGSWNYWALGCRSANRDWFRPTDRFCYVGFRVVVSPASN